MTVLSAEQTSAVDAALRWSRTPQSKTFALAGLAGTGKTTVVQALVNELKRAVVCAPTGKAASVLRGKGVAEATTIHSLIYIPAEACRDCGNWVDACERRNALCRRSGQRLCPRRGTTTRFARAQSLDADLVIVDEASMVTERILSDLQSFGKKLLFVGDHGQLQPIGRDPGLLRSPDVTLEKIHRQAEGSEIIRFAHALRSGAQPTDWTDTGEVTIHRGVPEELARFDTILCGFNTTRVAVSRRVRAARGFSSPAPQVADRIICLRNDIDRGLFNGMLGTVTSVRVSESILSFVDDLGEEHSDIRYAPRQFCSLQTLQDVPRDVALFDFGYALTAHKAQGSEWPTVCVLEQIGRSWHPSRWRYTAVTRGKRAVCYCLPVSA